MSRKGKRTRNETPQKQALREFMTSYLKEKDMTVQDGKDVNSIMRDMMSIILEGALDQEMEEKIISMYAKGMTTGDIESHMKDLYDIDISDSTISRITDKIMPAVREWQSRPLEEVYAAVFMDAIHYNVRQEGRIQKKAVYIALGIDMNGHKDILGLYVGDNESAKYWLSIINGLKNRGVKDILITLFLIRRSNMSWRT